MAHGHWRARDWLEHDPRSGYACRPDDSLKVLRRSPEESGQLTESETPTRSSVADGEGRDRGGLSLGVRRFFATTAGGAVAQTSRPIAPPFQLLARAAVGSRRGRPIGRSEPLGVGNIGHRFLRRPLTLCVTQRNVSCVASSTAWAPCHAVRLVARTHSECATANRRGSFRCDAGVLPWAPRKAALSKRWRRALTDRMSIQSYLWDRPLSEDWEWAAVDTVSGH